MNTYEKISKIRFVKPSELKKRCQSIALLDAILSPEWEYRYYSFNNNWSDSQQLASMRDGHGNELFILFERNQTILKGYLKESENQLLEDDIQLIPSIFSYFVSEPAFSIDYASFISWTEQDVDEWTTLSVVDNNQSSDMLKVYNEPCEMYVNWARSHYNKTIDHEIVEYIYNYKSINSEILAKHDIFCADLQNDIDEIGYPFH